jgi:NAD-dependent DNA ligase
MRIALDGRMTTPRKDIIVTIENSGHCVDSNITSKTDFLVQPDTTERITNKLRQAIQNKVEIITENQLYELLK